MYSVLILKVFRMPPHLKQFSAVSVWSPSWLVSRLLVMYHVQWFLWCGLLTMARCMKITVPLSWGLWSDLSHYPRGVRLLIYQCPHFKNEIFSRLPYTLDVCQLKYNGIFSHNFINKNVFEDGIKWQAGFGIYVVKRLWRDSWLLAAGQISLMLTIFFFLLEYCICHSLSKLPTHLCT